MALAVTTTTAPTLFSALTLGGKENRVQLKHRVVMAPLTRVRSGDSGVPTDVVKLYYSQRATDGGLQITEATNISARALSPGSSRGLEGGHPLNQPDGQLPVSSSATSFDGVKSHAVTREGRKDYVTPRALDISEIPGIVADYKLAAENAITAGFDGVEVHAGNGYLLEQFLCDGVNKRTDTYGGSIGNRARIIFEVLEAVLSVVPSSRVGIRLSPFGDTFGCKDSTPRKTYGYVIDRLNNYDLAYLHVIERRGRHADNVDAPADGVAHHFRGIYNGVLIAIRAVEDGTTDLVAFGRYFISNPDLVERLRTDADLNAFDSNTFFVQPDMTVETGYTDYPFLGEEVRSA
ncbi:hypothetical protein PI124_g8817 [Phytophthora idaei]|nr:hypothetical protein PI124_g8817 [Phytophthora idaei]